MTAETFAARLAEIAPSLVELKATDMSDALAQEFIGRYRCVPRSLPLACLSDNEIVRLVNNWDCSDVGIGMLEFARAPLQRKHKMQIGTVESDPLILDLNTGGIRVEELGTSGHVLWPVAGDGAKCLDALLHAAEFIRDLLIDKINHNDFPRARQAAQECASKAGGPEYLNFFLTLLGAEP